MGYLDVATGLPRLVADALLIGVFQSLALEASARRTAWISVTVAALGLALIAGVIVALIFGTLLGALEHVNRELYVVIVYGLAAAVGGLVASAVQAPLLRDQQSAGPWLIGNAIGAPLVLPALVLSMFGPQNLTVGPPLWLIGLAGGVGYGLTSGMGLVRSRHKPQGVS